MGVAMKPSAAYHAALEASKQVHKGKQFTGKFLRPHAPFIKEIIDRLGCKTVLDYGCGKGQQYEWVIPSTGQTIEQFWGVTVTKYDPAYPPFAKEPEGKFDLVICTQVLGAIPVSDIPWVVDRLYALADKAIYVSERLGDARKVLGDNALRPTEWSVTDWQFELGRIDQDIELTLATRSIVNGEKITSHFRPEIDCDVFDPDDHRGRDVFLRWPPVVWPPGIRAMNHKWTPHA